MFASTGSRGCLFEIHEVGEKLIAIVFSGAIFWQGFLVRKIVGTWLVPACLFSLFWFGYTFIPLVLLFNVPVEPLSIGYILVANLLFSCSAFAFDWRRAFRSNQEKLQCGSADYASWFIGLVFWTSTLVSLAGLIANSLLQGFTIADLLGNLFDSAERYTQMRYSDQISANVFGQTSTVLSYLGATLGGFLYFHARTTGRRLVLLLGSFLPSILVMLTQSAKGMLFLAIFMFYAAILVCRIADGDLRLFGPRAGRQAVMAGAVILPILAVSFLSRGLYGTGDPETIMGTLIHYFASYTCGHLYAFSDWFAHLLGKSTLMHYFDDTGAYGFYTFIAVFKLFGSEKVVPLGFFEEFFSYSDLLTTNIYTIYRGLILDFGLGGALVYSLLSGLLLHLSFYAMLINRKPSATVAVFIVMLGYFYTSFLISLLVWNSVYVSLGLIAVVLRLNRLLVRRAAYR